MTNKIYENYLSTHYAHFHKGASYENDIPYFKANFLKFLPKDKQSRILDVGCGTGIFLNFLKSKGYMDFVGVDISKEQVEFCKKHVTKNVVLIKDLQAYLSKNKSQFDFILLNDVIEHLEKEIIIDSLSAILASLVKNGVVLIKTANLKSRWGMAVRYMDFTHTAGFTEESMSQIMHVSGFKRIQIVKEIHPIHDIKSFFRIILKFFFEFIYRLENIASFGTFNPILSNMLIVVGYKN